jgi:hypothetical protein
MSALRPLNTRVAGYLNRSRGSVFDKALIWLVWPVKTYRATKEKS